YATTSILPSIPTVYILYTSLLEIAHSHRDNRPSCPLFLDIAPTHRFRGPGRRYLVSPLYLQFYFPKNENLELKIDARQCFGGNSNNRVIVILQVPRLHQCRYCTIEVMKRLCCCFR